jgi:hypothetical protein
LFSNEAGVVSGLFSFPPIIVFSLPSRILD